MTSTAGSSQARLWAWSWSSLPTTRSRLGVSAAGNDPKVKKRALADLPPHLREGTASLAQPGQDGDSSSKNASSHVRTRARFPARRRATPRPPQDRGLDRGLGPVLILIPLASRRALPPRPCRAAPGRDAPMRGAAGTEEGSLRSMACLVARVGQARDRQGPPEVGRESTLKARLRGLSPPQGQELLPPTLWCAKEIRRSS